MRDGQWLMFSEIAAKVLHQQFMMLCVVLLYFLSPLQITLPAYLLHTIDITCTVRTPQCHSSMYNGCIYESASCDATLLLSHCTFSFNALTMHFIVIDLSKFNFFNLPSLHLLSIKLEVLKYKNKGTTVLRAQLAVVLQQVTESRVFDDVMLKCLSIIHVKDRQSDLDEFP